MGEVDGLVDKGHAEDLKREIEEGHNFVFRDPLGSPLCS